MKWPWDRPTIYACEGMPLDIDLRPGAVTYMLPGAIIYLRPTPLWFWAEP